MKQDDARLLRPAPGQSAPSALLAVVLSGLGPGAGHLYLGRPGRALAWVVAVVAAFLAWASCASRSYAAFRWLAFPPLLLTLALIVDSGVLARRHRARPRPRRPWNRWWALLAAIVATGFLLPWALGTAAGRCFSVFAQPDDLMEPQLAPGDRVVQDPGAFRHDGPKRGDVVVVSLGDGTGSAARRLLALPGDLVEVRSGVVRVGGRERVEDYRLPQRGRDLFVAPVRLGEGECLVLGDRRLPEEASRCRVPCSRIAGRATWVLIPGDSDVARLGEAIR